MWHSCKNDVNWQKQDHISESIIICNIFTLGQSVPKTIHHRTDFCCASCKSGLKFIHFYVLPESFSSDGNKRFYTQQQQDRPASNSIVVFIITKPMFFSLSYPPTLKALLMAFFTLHWSHLKLGFSRSHGQHKLVLLLEMVAFCFAVITMMPCCLDSFFGLKNQCHKSFLRVRAVRRPQHHFVFIHFSLHLFKIQEIAVG